MGDVCRRLNNSKRHKLKRCCKLGNVLALTLLSQLLLKERQRVRLVHWFDCDDVALFNQLQCCLPAPRRYEDRPILALGEILSQRSRNPVWIAKLAATHGNIVSHAPNST